MPKPSSFKPIHERDEVGSRHAADDPTLSVIGLRPIQLSLWNLGPFRGEIGYTIRFLGPPASPAEISTADADTDPFVALRQMIEAPLIPPEEERAREPCNLFFIQGGEGSGKSTIVDTLHGLFDLLGIRSRGAFQRPGRYDFDLRKAKAQLDLMVRLVIDGTCRNILLSVWFGQEQAPVDWSDTIRTTRPWRATDFARIGFVDVRTEPARGTNELGHLILRAVRLRDGAGMTAVPAAGRDLCSDDLVAGHPALPTALLFKACGPTALRLGSSKFDRPRCYAPAKLFDLVGDPIHVLNASLELPTDGIEPWFDQLVDRVGQIVKLDAGRPKRIARDSDPRELSVVFDRRSFRPPMSVLGAGEQSLLSVHFGTLLGMTEATMVLIDGIDDFIEPRRYRSVIESLKRLAQLNPALAIIATARDPALVKSFDYRRVEANLIKGGELLRGKFDA